MKYLDPKNDLIFKKIFGEHPDILKHFLNAVLPLEKGRTIEDLKYLTPELSPETFLEKFSVVDARCIDNYGRQFIVEMQMSWSEAFRNRVVFNASKAFVNQTARMKLDYKAYKNLQPVYALNLIDHIYLPQDTNWYHHYQIVELANTKEQLNGLEFVFIELPKFKPETMTDKKMMVLWLRFLTELGAQTREIPKDLLSVKELERASETLYATSLTPEERYLYDRAEDRMMTERSVMEDSFFEGEAKGKAEGKIEAQYNIALNAKKMGISNEDISKLTGLTDDEIKNLH